MIKKFKEILNFILFLFYELFINLYSIIVNNKFSDGTKLNNSNFKKFNSIVDKVIYINLLERKDRRESCELLLNKIFDPDKIIRFNAIKDDNGSIGCSKSHIECLNIAIKNNWKNVLILEDDIKFNYDHIDNLYKLSKKDYDVIVLGGTWFSHNVINNNLLYCASTTSYLVNNIYYKTLKYNFEQGLNNYLIRKSYKNTIDYYWNSSQLVDNWKFIYPCIFIQKNCYSSIDKKNKNPEYDFKNKYYLKIYKFLKKN